MALDNCITLPFTCIETTDLRDNQSYAIALSTSTVNSSSETCYSIMTADEIQAARAIQDLNSSKFASSTPKSNDYGFNAVHQFDDSHSPVPFAYETVQISQQIPRVETPPATKRKLHLTSAAPIPPHHSSKILKLEQETSAFRTPQNKFNFYSGRSAGANVSTCSLGSLDSSSPQLLKVCCNSPNSSRYDNSLSVLTQRFIDFMNSSTDGVINLNAAAVVLETPKRRIYDITNVLEGIDLIAKSGKNSCRWKLHPLRREFSFKTHPFLLPNTVDELEECEKKLDAILNLANGCLYSDTQDRNLAYVQTDDMNMIDLSGKNLIAIQATEDSVIEVPDPADFDYQSYVMTVKTQHGKLNVSIYYNNNQDIAINDQPDLQPSEHATIGNNENTDATLSCVDTKADQTTLINAAKIDSPCQRSKNGHHCTTNDFDDQFNAIFSNGNSHSKSSRTTPLDALLTAAALDAGGYLNGVGSTPSNLDFLLSSPPFTNLKNQQSDSSIGGVNGQSFGDNVNDLPFFLLTPPRFKQQSTDSVRYQSATSHVLLPLNKNVVVSSSPLRRCSTTINGSSRGEQITPSKISCTNTLNQNVQHRRSQTNGSSSAFDSLFIDSPSNAIIDEYLFALNTDEGLIDLFGQSSGQILSSVPQSERQYSTTSDRSKPLSKATRALNL